MKMKKILLFSGMFLLTVCLRAQEMLPYLNPGLPIETRVADLLGRMTPEEKFRQLFMVAGDPVPGDERFREGLFGFQMNTAQQSGGAADQMMNYAVGGSALETARKTNALQHYFAEQTRLGIPVIPFDEALHGLVRREAVSFPQSIALAASFDTALVHKIGLSIAEECRARGLRMILSPVVNLATDVRWGRVEETYGEDPLLVSEMGIAYVSALESRGIITTPKHFAVNHGDGGRDSYPVEYSERLLNERYFVPFRKVIEKAGARSIMTAYNSLDGRPCSASNYLLSETLKKQWGFRGFVISDAGAVGGANVLHFTAADYADAGRQSIENGLDVIFQTDFSSYGLFSEPFHTGQVDAAAVDSAVARVLRMKFELGLFENPFTDTTLNVARDSHRELAYEAAVKSAVLLKNDAETLPLAPDMKRLAVIGPDAIEGRLGGYSGPGNQVTTLLDGLRQAFAATQVLYAPGCGREDMQYCAVPETSLFHGNEAGLQAAYFDGIILADDPVVQRIDGKIDFQWTLFAPDPQLHYDFFSVRWTGRIVRQESGAHRIGIEGNYGCRLYLEGKLLIDTWDKQGYGTELATVTFKKGRSYDLRVEYKEPSGSARIKLVWDAGVRNESSERIADAVKLAKKSDAVIIVAGIEEGEFRDRRSLRLPGRQEALIRSVAATGKPVCVVLIGGSAVTMNDWLRDVGAVLDAWYPGEAGGEAIAALLAGKENPSGKLPVTFPQDEGQLPLVYNHKPTGRGDDYADGSGKPLFAFGHGLSYTTFEYAGLQLPDTVPAGAPAEITFDLMNTGDRYGEEVVQLYLCDELATVARPVKELKAFRRVGLQPGERRRVTFQLEPEAFEMLNASMQTVIEPGSFRVMIGSSGSDLRLRGNIYIQ